MYSPVFLSWPTTSGSPPVLSISLSDHSFSAVASSFACTLAHSRPLWRFMFFSKRAFNALSSSLRCSGNKSLLLLLSGWCIALRSPSIHLLLSRFRRPVGRLNAELLCVLRGQPLPAPEIHRLATSDAADGRSAQKPIQNIEGNVPAGGAPGDEAAIDVGPQRQARAASKVFEFPPGIVVLKHPGSVGSRHSCFDRRGRSHPGELYRGSNCTHVP